MRKMRMNMSFWCMSEYSGVRKALLPLMEVGLFCVDCSVGGWNSLHLSYYIFLLFQQGVLDYTTGGSNSMTTE